MSKPVPQETQHRPLEVSTLPTPSCMHEIPDCFEVSTPVALKRCTMPDHVTQAAGSCRLRVSRTNFPGKALLLCLSAFIRSVLMGLSIYPYSLLLFGTQSFASELKVHDEDCD